MAAFFILFDARQLNPTYLDWLLSGDAAQHHIGWEFFRYEPWQFPLGKISGFGTPDGTSIVYTDSIPIVALVFKAARSLLPDRFQYVGIWLLGCYALQGFFGWLLASLVARRTYPRVLMTCFFLLSPILIDRNVVGHHSLMAHWLILAAIYLAFQSEQQFESRHPRLNWWVCWGCLVVLSGLIHLYIAAMVVLVFLAAAISSLRTTRLKPSVAVLAITSTLGAFLFALYLEGAFILDSENLADPPSNGYLSLSMNLLAPLSPGYWSNKHDVEYMSLFVQPHHAYGSGQYEGFNYLGFGALLLFVAMAFGVVVFAMRYLGGRSIPAWAEPAIRTPRLVVIALLLMVGFALTQRISMGDQLILQIPLSTEILRRAEVFRSAGRFFWPCYYALLFWGFRGLSTVTRLNRGLFPILLHAALTFQAVDLSAFMKHNADVNRGYGVFHNTLDAPAWYRYVRQCDNIKYYPPGELQLYVPLGLMAAPRRVGVNVAYKARRNEKLNSQAHEQLKRELESGELSFRTLYVFKDAQLFSRLKENPKHDEFELKTLNGYHVAMRVARDVPRQP